MKNQSLKEKFKNNISVRPLYRKIRKVRPNNLVVAINVDNTYKLEGNDFKVKRRISSDVNGEILAVNSKLNYLPGECEHVPKYRENVIPKFVSNPILLSNAKVQNLTVMEVENGIHNMNSDSNSIMMTNKIVQAERLVVFNNIADTWLRVYPLPALPKESTCSLILRCMFCQLGLATIIVLWTLIWTFVIHSFEGPYEIEVTENFVKEQNQLVVDLATELRQITPISLAWRRAIEKRIGQERQMTILAVSRGAQVHTGQFWDLAGTFLFNVYVMTALGFGAPVPHTIGGRSSALIYAVIAVPAHIYLMVNASACLMTHIGSCCCRKKKIPNSDKISGNKIDNQNCGRNSELMKTSNNGRLRKKLLCVICCPCAGHCIPLAMLVYYAIGAALFGVLRDQPLDEIFMFPLEFTTSGGLELVEGYLRVLYGIYIEGAMALLSCALVILRRNSSDTINSIAESYRLFQVDHT